jgi:hypothetical protein
MDDHQGNDNLFTQRSAEATLRSGRHNKAACRANDPPVIQADSPDAGKTASGTGERAPCNDCARDLGFAGQRPAGLLMVVMAFVHHAGVGPSSTSALGQFARPA